MTSIVLAVAIGIVGVLLGVGAFLFLAGLGLGSTVSFVGLLVVTGAVVRWRHRHDKR